jgi:hypothetical protein
MPFVANTGVHAYLVICTTILIANAELYGYSRLQTRFPFNAELEILTGS